MVEEWRSGGGGGVVEVEVEKWRWRSGGGGVVEWWWRSGGGGGVVHVVFMRGAYYVCNLYFPQVSCIHGFHRICSICKLL